MPSEIDKFWTLSGRVNSFAFEIVAANNLNKHLGWLEGVTSGKLSFGYDTDLKVSGSLEVSSQKFIENCVIRVHYRPKLGTDESKKRVLCTCFALTDKMVFDKGRYSGSIELRSMLAQYADDKLRSGFTIGKNKSYKAELKRLVKSLGSRKYSVSSNVKDKMCAKATAFEVGKAPMEVIQSIADSLGGQVGVDTDGRMVIGQYLRPAKKTCSKRLPSGEYSVTLPGVEIEDDGATVPNRVSYKCEVSWKQTVYVLDKKGRKQKYTSGSKKGKYKTKTEKKSKVIVGRAQVASSSALHYNNRGRWVTEVFSCKRDLGTKGLNSTSALEAKFADLQAEMNKKAANKLTSVSYRTKKYTIECYFLPVSCGEVVEFEYIASGLKLHVQAMITAIELSLDKGARMKMTLKHVRYV